MTAAARLIDWVATRVAIWSLRRLFGANCTSDINDDYPGEGLHCPSCDAKRLIDSIK